MGNSESGCFVDPAIPPLIRDQVVPRADVVTPNQFELGELAGTALPAGAALADVLAAADAVPCARALRRCW